MPWKKSPPDLIARFERAKPSDANVQSRPMFGYPSVFLGGNHFAGTFQDKIVVRVGTEPKFAEARKAQPFEPMPGRAMTGYVIVPDAIAKDATKLREWVSQAHIYAKTLPPKGTKKTTVTKKPAKRTRG